MLLLIRNFPVYILYFERIVLIATSRNAHSATSRVILLLLALSIVHLYFEIDLKEESIERKTYYLSPKVY